MNDEMYIIFQTRTDGLAMEKKLKVAEIDHEMVPTPRQFSTSCSISIKIMEKDLREVQTILAYSPNIKSRGVHKVEKKGFSLFSRKKSN
tara:strand:+ start:985 stop:1251 length:267 start_codon:yes stop_codon:yes gene_type:complete